MDSLQSIFQQVALIDEGEVTADDRVNFFHVVTPPFDSESVLYATKSHAMDRFTALLQAAPHCGILVRHGIPQVADVSWIRHFVGNRKLYFLGDCDPFDLLVYQAVASEFDMNFLGISDRFLSAMDVELKPSLSVAIEGAEARAWEMLLETRAPIESWVGEKCFGMLNQGRKMEVEAVVSYACQPLTKLFDCIP